LEVKNITAGYKKDFDILHEVSMDVKEKEIVAIIGPNGAGKSTLLKAIVGLVRCTEGDIFFEDTPITRIKPSDIVKKGIGYVPQAYNVFPSLTVFENLEIGGFSKKDSKDSVNEVFTLFPELKECKNKRAGLLSGGQQKMLAVGRALIPNPRIILLDEPFAKLSPLMVKMLTQRLEAMNKERNVAILIVEQNILTVLRFSDRACVLRMGRILFEQPAEQILKEGNWSELLFATET
jgi:ABC-type branched-subunit amino acid transport system ATPase component